MSREESTKQYHLFKCGLTFSPQVLAECVCSGSLAGILPGDELTDASSRCYGGKDDCCESTEHSVDPTDNSVAQQLWVSVSSTNLEVA